jgi:hypothetical protein
MARSAAARREDGSGLTRSAATEGAAPGGDRHG